MQIKSFFLDLDKMDITIGDIYKAIKNYGGAFSVVIGAHNEVENEKVEGYYFADGYNNFMNFIGVILGLYAAYLSWMCNPTLSTMERALWAALAFVFGFFYLIYFFLFKKGLCLDGTKPAYMPDFKALMNKNPSGYARMRHF